ncbi:hexokinase [Tirmania nivea]|nr:hexokinase [Tirmania nivea]
MYLSVARRTPSRRGSMHDVPKELMDTIHELEKLFSVDINKMHAIVNRFMSELEKGLSKEGGSIPMNPTWVIGYPTGDECGTYLALDMGGTNLRVCEVELPEEKGQFEIYQSKYRLPDEIKVGDSDQLWDYMAECVKQFLIANHEGQDLSELPEMPLGFTFSYPCTQNAIDHGILQRWTKGFDIDNVEGRDVVPLFEDALQRKGVPVKIVALINDTTGTLIASAYTDDTTRVGCIFGTGCNAAYMEEAGCIPKLEHMKLDPKLPIAINCEWGAFDNEKLVLPRTTYDAHIDKTSPRPGQQLFEKMVAGLYLGEIFRLVLVDLHSNVDAHMFQGQDISKLKLEFSLDAAFLSDIENDPWENLMEVQSIFENKLNISTTEPERKLIRRLAELIGTRAARLSACGVAAICKKKGYTSCHVGADGSVFNKYPHFQERQAQALREIFNWGSEIKNDPIQVVPAEDGSGVGAALIAALTLNRIKQGIHAGVNVKRKNSLIPVANS